MKPGRRRLQRSDIVNANTHLGQFLGSRKKPFPIFVFQAALFKDTLDLITFGTLSLVTTPLMWIVLLLWAFSRGVFRRKDLKKRFAIRSGIGFVVEILPIISFFIPATSILVYSTYKSEQKKTRLKKRSRVTSKIANRFATSYN